MLGEIAPRRVFAVLNEDILGTSAGIQLLRS
jgi:hypothetical protein